VWVERDGEYEIALRRWPADKNWALNTGCPEKQMTAGKLPAGKALPIAQARLMIAGQKLSTKTATEDQAAVFRLTLKGGIGTGTVSLGGFGDLRDWEIFSRPAKGCWLPWTFVAMRLSGGGLAKPVLRAIERQHLPPFPGNAGTPNIGGIGFPAFGRPFSPVLIPSLTSDSSKPRCRQR
jgi:hypothetical protein